MREEEKAERKRRNEEMAKKAAGRTLELAEGSMAGYEAKQQSIKEKEQERERERLEKIKQKEEEF